MRVDLLERVAFVAVACPRSCTSTRLSSGCRVSSTAGLCDLQERVVVDDKRRAGGRSCSPPSLAPEKACRSMPPVHVEALLHGAVKHQIVRRGVVSAGQAARCNVVPIVIEDVRLDCRATEIDLHTVAQTVVMIRTCCCFSAAAIELDHVVMDTHGLGRPGSGHRRLGHDDNSLLSDLRLPALRAVAADANRRRFACRSEWDRRSGCSSRGRGFAACDPHAPLPFHRRKAGRLVNVAARNRRAPREAAAPTPARERCVRRDDERVVAATRGARTRIEAAIRRGCLRAIREIDLGVVVDVDGR